MTVKDPNKLEQTSSDANNNEIVSTTVLVDIERMRLQHGDEFIERRLKILNNEFLIVPNGASGDCMFKAVCQAVFNMNERNHATLRTRLVDFILENKWEKFKESIEIQHFNGNNILFKKWKSNPKKAYHNYMKSLGTLGSSSELTAAGEMLTFNFATIQEYSESDCKTYRVENCCHFKNLPIQIPFHFFLFTGDYDNGHWEYLKPLESFDPNPRTLIIPDGMYSASMTTMIQGSETTVDDWLKIHTENTNNIFSLKHTIHRTIKKASQHPFEWDIFNYESEGMVHLQNNLYRITSSTHTDLFTTLAHVLLQDKDAQNSTLVDRLEEEILEHRRSNFSELNQKLITQPHSHGFVLANFKYLSMPAKGNIQDLLAAADMFGFSFQVFIKSTSVHPLQACKFLHIDRWGGEADKMEYFVMKLISPKNDEDSVFSKWWHLTLIDEICDKRKSDDGLQNDENQNIGDNITRPSSSIKTVPKEDSVNSIANKYSNEAVEIPTENPQLCPSSIYSFQGSDHAKEIDTDQSKNSSENVCTKVSTSVTPQPKHIKDKSDGDSSSEKSDEESNASLLEEPDMTEMEHKDSNIVVEDQQKNETNFAKMHDNFWKGKQQFHIPAGVITKLPKIKWSKDKFKLLPVHLPDQNSNPSKHNDQSKKFKTVVELYDEKSQRRKKYVYDGYLDQENILETLYLQGYVKRPDGESFSKHSLLPRKALSGKTQPLAISEKNSSSLDKSSNNNSIDVPVEVVPKPNPNIPVKFVEPVYSDCDFKTPSHYAMEKLKIGSPSVIPLTDAESINRTNKFLGMHRRLAPVGVKEPAAVPKSCLKRFFSWFISFFKK